MIEMIWNWLIISEWFIPVCVQIVVGTIIVVITLCTFFLAKRSYRLNALWIHSLQDKSNKLNLFDKNGKLRKKVGMDCTLKPEPIVVRSEVLGALTVIYNKEEEE